MYISPTQSDLLIVGIPDHPAVVFVLRSHGLPPFSKCVGVRDNFLVVASVVVRLDHRVRATAGNVVDLLRKVAQVSCIRRPSHAVGDQAFHVEVDPEGVETFRDESVIGRQGRPNELFSVQAREVDANPLHLASSFGMLTGRSNCQTHCARRSKDW
jgi:hypothetical protein